MTQRCERGDLSRGTGEFVLWAMLAALATGCCATQSAEEGQRRGGAITGQVGPAAPLEFVALTVDEAARRLWPEPGPDAYTAPDAAQTEALAGLLRRMLGESPPPPGELALLAARAGFTLQGWEVDGQRYLAVIEEASRRAGGGAYVLRVGASAGRPVILQAPHAFFDLGTERIALELLFAGRGWPRALFVNTVHRYLGPDGQRRRQSASPADPCHSPQHLFAVATAAALDVLPEAEVVQLHGFGDDPDDGEDGADTTSPQAIVSGGRAALATPRSEEVATRLRSELGVEVALFPTEIGRLGGTTNVQGRAILARGAAEFVHIELSRTLREQLRRDPAARERFAAALRPDPMPGTPSP
jgi:hypothetical protein